MAFIQAVRPGGWGKFSTPAVINKTNIIGSFNNSYGGGFGVGMPMYGGGMMMGGCTMDYGCCGGGGGMKPFWGGFLGGFLGGILNFFGGGGGSRVSDSSSVYAYQQGPGGGGNDVDGLQKLLGKDYNVSFLNGEYAVKDKDGNILTGKTPQDIIDQINGGGTTTGAATRVGGSGTGTTPTGKDQLAEECAKFNEKYTGQGANLEVITDPNDPNKNEYKLTYTTTDKDGKPKQETATVKTVIEAENLLSSKGIKPSGGTGAAGGTGNQGGTGAAGGTGGAGGAGGAGNKGGGTGTVSPEADFEKLLNKSKFPDWSYDPQKGLTINGKTYKTPEDAYKDLKGFDTVGSNGFALNALNNQAVDVIDHDAKVGDIIGKTATVSGSTMTINGHTYEVVSGGGDANHIYLKDTNPTKTGAGNQVYILEKGADGKYRLSQYEDTTNTEGYGIAAHPGFNA